MINPLLMQSIMKGGGGNGSMRIVRPCEPEWVGIGLRELAGIKAMVADAAKRHDCSPNDFCVEAHFLKGGELSMVKVQQKQRPALKGWQRLKVGVRILLKGKI
jgi:hypothetical protein